MSVDMPKDMGKGECTLALQAAALSSFHWPSSGLAEIPDWIYTSDVIYREEIYRIFRGPTWNFVGLEAEIPAIGDFRRAYVGETPVVVVRSGEGQISVVENRCRHRGTEFCRNRSGNVSSFICPYHQWQYDLQGNLKSIPFRRGIQGKGGMPADFKFEDNGLTQLHVATRHGLIFASFSAEVGPLEEYLGPEVLDAIDTVFEDRKIRVLGYLRQRWPSNWKLYHENLRDPNHASLLHVFLSTFGLFSADQQSVQLVSECGRHAVGVTKKSAERVAEATQEMRSFREGYKLSDPRLLEYFKEDTSEWSASIASVWPNFALQRQVNALAVRECIPNGPNEFYLHWTFLGYSDDTKEMLEHRLRQGNLVAAAGYIGADDSEVLGFVQDGLRKSTPGSSVVRLGGDQIGSVDHFVNEAAIRSLYKHYRAAMGV